MFVSIKKIFIGLLTGIVIGSNIESARLKQSKNAWLNLLSLIYILMDTVSNFTTIHFRLNYIDVLEVVILWMIYLIKYAFQIKQKI